MNKQQIVSRLWEKSYVADKHSQARVSQNTIAHIAADLLELIDETVTNGESVNFNGRTFKLIVRAPRMGRNPKTGESIEIPERRFISYKKRLKS